MAGESGPRCDQDDPARTTRRPAAARRPRRTHSHGHRAGAVARPRRRELVCARPRAGLCTPRNAVFAAVPLLGMDLPIAQPLRIGIGGPVGSGKTALTLALCRALRDRYELAVVTNDIYTEEDAQFLVRNEALPPERIMGVETGGCPHTAIREDASINLEAVARLSQRFPDLDLVFVESGGDNLAATFSPE